MTRVERFDFAGSEGAELAGRLDLPEGEPRAYALFAHCFTSSTDLVAAARISRRLVEQGFGVLRFDFTGLGSGGGELANTGVTSSIEDLTAAAEALGSRFDSPRLLIGHSRGGSAALAAAPEIPSVTAVVTIGAPFDADGSHHLDRDLRRFGGALLVMHSPADDQVDLDNARRIYEAASHPKSFVTLDGADHLLTRRVDAEYAADVLAAWSSRYLPDPEVPAVEPPPGGVVLVEESGRGRLAQSIQAGRHFWVADEPLGVGDDTGPTPYDLLLSALGACTAMTLRMYADRKGWPLDHVSVELAHRRSHSQDCADASGTPCSMEHIDREIRLVGPLDAEQRTRLAQIADRCPVHRTVTGRLDVATTVVDSPNR